MGYSNGGAFSYSLALETDKFAAIVSMSASFFEGRSVSPDVNKISVMQVHGELDSVVPYYGGQSMNLDIIFQSAMETVMQWVQHNEISETSEVTNPENNLTLYSFKDDENPYEVALYRLEGTNHNISVHPFYSSNRCYSEIMEFFNRHSKN